MLRHLNMGTRRLGDWPIWAHKRPNWEFYAVLKGHAGLLFEANSSALLETSEKLPVKESHLWVFPPQHSHGWWGGPETTSEVAVFHFDNVPHALESAMTGLDYLEQPLTGEDCKQLERMVQALKRDYEHPTPLGNLRAQRALIDLTLLVLADAPQQELIAAEQKTSQKVDDAVRWFRQHMRERPSVEELAAAVHVSPTQLRRLFADVRNETPQQTMSQIRLENAARLLADTDELLDSIAAECGFFNASDFCRSFKAYRGCTPAQWRKRLPSYEKSHVMYLKEFRLEAARKSKAAGG